jgi:hypothetical protein
MNMNTAYPSIINQYPKSTLGYKTNNQYPQFPPLMNDGRSVISSWNTETSMNDKLKSENRIHTNWEYRKYLIDNAMSIMKENFVETANDTGSGFVSAYKPTDGQPFLVNSINDKNAVEISSSDLKDIYLSREQLYSRKFVPTFQNVEK